MGHINFQDFHKWRRGAKWVGDADVAKCVVYMNMPVCHIAFLHTGLAFVANDFEASMQKAAMPNAKRVGNADVSTLVWAAWNFDAPIIPSPSPSPMNHSIELKDQADAHNP